MEGVTSTGAGPALRAVPALRARVFGPLTVERGDRRLELGGPKERAVLATLLAADRLAVTVDGLIDAVWRDDPPPSATRTVHSYIARLRRAFTVDASVDNPLVTRGRSYLLDLPRTDVDACRFEDAAHRGHAMLARHDALGAVTAFDEALDEWRGEPYEAHQDIASCAVAARSLEELRRVVIEERFEALLTLGGAGDLVPALTAAVEADPLRERLWAQLMLALYRSGGQADALRTYQRARSMLVDEVGVEPGAGLRELEAAILAQDDERLLASGGQEPTNSLPEALDAGTSAIVGRSEELARLRDLWVAAGRGEGGLVAILGVEGIGKTRLVAEFAAEVHRNGGVVAFARCDSDHRSARRLLDQALRSAGGSLWRAEADDVPGQPLGVSVARRLASWASVRPVLTVLDDLHEADVEVLEVVADVAASTHGSAVLVVVVFRTEPGEPVPQTEQQIVLEGLDRPATSAICALYGDAWTAAEVDRIHGATGGEPLAVHELARSVVVSASGHRLGEAADDARLAGRRLAASEQAVEAEVVGIRRVTHEWRRQLATRTGAAATSICPFRGLQPFETADAEWFFGRERMTAQIVAQLVTHPALLVVGPSGSGKSSLVRAGVVPALADGILAGSENWQPVILTPGTRPNETLASALAGTADERCVIIVDQLEELFTPGVSEDERDRFARSLADLIAHGAALIAVIRADQIGGVARVGPLADLVAGHDVLVSPVTERELRDAIARPAEVAGLRFEDGLVDEIVADARGSAGALPFVQTALLETWERRSGNMLTLDGYRLSGGVTGAIARMAEDMHGSLTPGQQLAAWRILLRLSDASDVGTLDLRRRTPISDVARRGDRDAWTALERMVQHRLLTVSGDTVEVAHETLLREWPRLRRWLEDDVAGRRLHQRLGDAARGWVASGRDPSELLRGSRLAVAEEWTRDHEADLNDIERELIDASRAEEEHELREAVARADHAARASRRLRRILAGAAVLLVLTLVAGAGAIWQGHRAGESARQARGAERLADERAAQATDAERLADERAAQATDAERLADDRATQARAAERAAVDSARAADAGRLSALAVNDIRIDRAMLTAVAAVRLADLPATRTGLLNAIQRAPFALGLRRLSTGDRPQAITVSPDGRLLAVASNSAKAFVFDAETLEELAVIDGVTSWGMTWLSDGRLAYGARDEGRAAVLVVDPLRPEVELARYDGAEMPMGPWDVAVDDEHGRIVAAGGSAGRVVVAVWDDDQPAAPTLEVVIPHEGGDELLEILPDGSIMVITWGGVVTIDPKTGEDLGTIPSAAALAISTVAGLAAVMIPEEHVDGWNRASVAIYELSSRQHLRTVQVASGVTSLVFTGDGTQLLVGTEEHGTEIWEPTGRRLGHLSGQANRIRSIVVSPDDTIAYSVSLDGTLAKWDLGGGRAVFRRRDVSTVASRHVVDGLVDAGDFKAIARSNGDVLYIYTTKIAIRDGGTGAINDMSPIDTGSESWIYSAEWSPDGERFATASGDGTVMLFDRRTGTELASWNDPLHREAGWVGFSPRGDTIVVGLGGLTAAGELIESDQVVLLDADDLAERAWLHIRGLGSRLIWQVRFSPDGSSVLVQTGPGFPEADGRSALPFLAMFDLADHRELWRIDPGGGATAAFTADGRAIALGGADGTVSIIDATSGRSVAGPVTAHDGVVNSVAFSRGGELVASAGTDGIVRVLRAADLQDVAVFDPSRGNGPSGGLHAVFTATDGSRLLLLDANRVWDVPIGLDTLIEHACRVAGRELTEQEWSRLLPDRPYETVCG